MLKQLTLTNFRRIENDIMIFSGGLNVIRGDNEASKTTRIESILYAFFSSKGLREPLAKVVTYDKPEGSLKVELDFSYDGVDYHIKRGKSGAELTYGDQSVTGQTEVRVFCRRLFGCSADTAKQLVIADQNSVRGVLHRAALQQAHLWSVWLTLRLSKHLSTRFRRSLAVETRNNLRPR